jgi:hypothetical protein
VLDWAGRRSGAVEGHLHLISVCVGPKNVLIRLCSWRSPSWRLLVGKPRYASLN